MGVRIKGQSTWDSKAAQARLEATALLWSTHMLKPTDAVRFPKAPGTRTKIEGRPLAVASDGSITCSAAGKLRAIRPEQIEVKMQGPRGGTQWAPLIPDTDKDT
jgi:hypothetical protein